MRLAWVLFTALTAGACGGGGATTAGDQQADPRNAPAPPVAPASSRSPVGPGPSATQGGVPVGYEQSADGAAAAATTYLSALHQVVGFAESERRAALDVLTAKGADVVIEDATAALATLDGLVAQARTTTPNARLFLREVPMAYTVSGFTGGRAQVKVWSLGVIIIEGTTQATEVWSTNTVELVWEGDDWKVWSWARRPGPQPVLAPATAVPATQVLDAVEGWEGYRYVPDS